MTKQKRSGNLSPLVWTLLTAALLATIMLCLCAGSVAIPLRDTVNVLWRALWGQEAPAGLARAIVLPVRLPRVLCTALIGASLALSGAAMQGLLRNPLADGSTLGVSSGAALGAVLALAFGVSVPGLPEGGVTAMAILFAFLSLLLILSMAYALDRSLDTGSIILIGVIFSMFVSSLMNLVISFAGEKLRSIAFWTMGSLMGVTWAQAGLLAVSLALCGTVILRHARELDALSIDEDVARHVGVNVRRVKLTLLIAVSVLIGVSVSVGGTIAFVGLVVPHMARRLAGSPHGRLLPASMLGGAIFLLLADLIARTILRPVELSIGVVTSLVGAVAFAAILYRTRKDR